MNNKCPDCGEQMEMYYTMQCFHCKKPMPDEKDRGNLLKARNWLVNNEPEFNKDKFWRECCDWEIFQGNDTWCTMPSEEHCDDKEQLKLFAKHFPTKDVLWFVSW